jgi:hypothetical protein
VLALGDARQTAPEAGNDNADIVGLMATLMGACSREHGSCRIVAVVQRPRDDVRRS